MARRRASLVFFASFARWAMLLLALAGCGGGSSSDTAPAPPAPALASITVSATATSLEPGRTLTVTAVAKDSQGNTISGASLQWASSNTAVATVAADGTVTGVARGSTNISASSGSITSNAVVLAVVAAAPPGVTSSSEELIDLALAAGTIDADTALQYKVYAAFRDPRLPAAYVGDDSEAFESPAVAELLDRFETLPAAMQDQLAPYLLRPADKGSWLDPAVRSAIATGTALPSAPGGRMHALGRPGCGGTQDNWVAVDVTTAQVRVWYDKTQGLHGVIAQRVAGYLQNDVWPKMITTLGFARPMDDSTIVGCDGGNGKLDVYIVDSGVMSDRGQTIETFSSFRQGPVHVRIKEGLPIEQEKHTVSHEFGHAIHWAYLTKASQKSYGWFRDGFANWVSDQVYPGNDSLNRMARCHLNSNWLSLDDQAAGYCGNNKRNYGAYLPLQFIAKTKGTDTVRAIMANTLSYDTAIESIDKTVPGGLKDLWPLYARKLWNQEPVLTRDAPEHYNQWDTLNNVPVHVPQVAPDQPDAPNPHDADLNGAAEKTTTLERRINNMSVRYYHFAFAQEFTRSLMFHNTFYELWKNSKAVSVRALFKVEGRPWDEEDWTPYEWIGWCRDFKLQRLERLVVVVASAEWQGPNPVIEANEPPELMRNVVGCWGFKGTATRTETYTSSGRNGTVVASFTSTWDTHFGGVPEQLTLASEGRLRVPIASPFLTGGSWTLTENYSEGACNYRLTAAGSDSSQTQGGNSFGTIVINSFNESLPANVRGPKEQLVGRTSLAYVADAATVNKVGGGLILGPPPDCGGTYESSVSGWWITGDTPPHAVIGADGKLTGTYRADPATFTWTLSPIRQP